MQAGELASLVLERAEGQSRFVVAIAGPPGSGKSTLARQLVDRLNGRRDQAALLPMDGFHFDNRVLGNLGLVSRKGAPETFDFDGFFRLFSAIRTMESPIYAPAFDRELDLARAGALEIRGDHRMIVAEGNYLLLDGEPWTKLAGLFDLTVFLNVAEDELERRLIRRWLDHGHDRQAAERRARGNDMVNARLVNSRRMPADILLSRTPAFTPERAATSP